MAIREDKIQLKRSSISRAKQIIKFMLPYKQQYLLGIVILFIGSGVMLLFPMLLGQLVNSGNKDSAVGLSTVEEIDEIGIKLIILMIVLGICSFMRVSLFVSATQKMMADLRGAVYTNLIRLPMEFFSKRRVGEINSRMAADITQLEEAFTITVAELARQLIIIVGGVTYLAITSFKLTLLMLSIVPVVAIAAVVFGRFIRKLSKEKQNLTADANVIIEETLQGIANVKAFANEIFEITRYKKSVSDIRTIAMKGGVWRGGFAAFIIFSLFGSMVAVIWYAAILILNNELNNGNIIEFIVFSGLIGGSIGGVADRYAQIQKAVGATENLLDLLDEEHEAIEIEKSRTFDTINGDIKFENVGFTYPSRSEMKVMENVSFEVRKGQQIAIVGPSGAGKSTLISLLMRFYDPQEGSILIDGIDYTSYSLEELRGQMAMVPQEVLLFGGTVRENIAYGKPNANDAEIIEADDYMKLIPPDIPNKEWDIWATDLKLNKPNPYPLRSYEDFEEIVEERRLDPLASIAEGIGKLRPGEYMFIHILITPIMDELRVEGEEVIRRLMGRPEEVKKGSILGAVGSLGKEVLTMFGFAKEEEERKDDMSMLPEFRLTAGEREIIKKVDEKTSKIAFNAMVRFMYIGRNDVFSKTNVSTLFGFFRQFNTHNLNSFRPNAKTLPKRSFVFFKNTRTNFRKLRLFTFASGRFRLPGSISPYFKLNVEELATMFHFPGQVVKAPGLLRVESRKAPPPPGLPVDLDLE
ncbi:MAG: ABC transporter ATP-binding protein [Bacteroidetes bacterium]|nr:ABC transporter ATP-binding protein [Bacteroidota bacterium]